MTVEEVGICIVKVVEVGKVKNLGHLQYCFEDIKVTVVPRRGLPLWAYNLSEFTLEKNFKRSVCWGRCPKDALRGGGRLK